MFDALFQELVTLQNRTEDAGLQLILGGGMGLWLRDVFLEGARSPQYPLRPPSRSTEDLDLLLTARVVVDAEAMNQLRDILDDLGYAADVEYMQFNRSIPVGTTQQTVKVDLLAAPPAEKDLDKVKIKMPRIRPKDASDIHGYLTPEAVGIEIEPVTLDVSASTSVRKYDPS